MLKEIRKLCIKLLIIIGGVILISAIGLVIYYPNIMKTNNAAYVDKAQRIESLDSPKAVFVGGSATAFGIHAEQFQVATGMESVNMGMNAGVSFRMYIETILPNIKQGDVVFLTPEYSYYPLDYNGIEENDIFMICYFRPQLLKTLSIGDVPNFMKAAISTGLQNWSNLTNETIRDIVFGEGYGVYYRTNLNEYGDFIGQKGLESKQFASLPMEHRMNNFVPNLDCAIGLMEEKGAKVYVLFPPYADTEYAQNEQFIDQIRQALSQAEHVELLFEPTDSEYPVSSFFDTVYHLTWEAAQQHTDMIIDRYQKAAK